MKNLKSVFAFLFILSLGLLIVGCQDVSAAEDAYVTIDINPSIELIVSPKEKVVYANPLNEDGELLLANLDLIGLDLDVALELIIDEAIDLGFIDIDAEETLVSVNTISRDENLGEKIQTRAKEHINNAFMDRAMMGRAQDKGFTPDELAEAESYGVTPGFLKLAKSVIEYDDTILLEDALLLSQQELMDILKEARTANKEMMFALREEFHAQRNEIFNEYHPQIVALEAEIAALEALIEAEEGDLVALQADLDQKLLDLAALQDTFRQAMEQLRISFQAEIDDEKDQLMIMNQMRIQEHRQAVEAFRNAIQERKGQLIDEIENFQNGNQERP